MPIFNIDSINYIVTGKTEKLVNLDITRQNPRDDNDPIDIQNITFVTDENIDSVKDRFIPSYDSHKLKRLSSDSVEENRGSTGYINALFDFKDVAIQSTIAKSILKGVDSQTEINTKDYVEIYGPHLEENPIGFCQYGDFYSLGITDRVKKSPVLMTTSNWKSRRERLLNDIGSLDWQFMFDDGNGTFNYTYTPLSNLTLRHSVTDPLSAYYPVNSYYDYLTSHGDLSASTLSNLLLEKYSYNRVAHNYIYEIPTSNSSGTSRLYNDHNNAIVQGELLIGKNMYDAEYSTNMDHLETLNRTREYCGIGQCGNKVFFKYYDENSYNVSSRNGDNESTRLSTSINTPVQNLNLIENRSKVNSYQNIEVMESINRFRNNCWHKSNLYRITIQNCGLDEAHLSSNLTMIKKDIENSVRVIAESLAPAHTQLFDVAFA